MTQFAVGDRIRVTGPLSSLWLGAAGTVTATGRSGLGNLLVELDMSIGHDAKEILVRARDVAPDGVAVGDYVRVALGHRRNGGTLGKVKALNNADRKTTLLLNRHGLHISVEAEALGIVQPHEQTDCPTPQGECIACIGYDEDTAKMNAPQPKITIGTEVIVKGHREIHWRGMMGAVSAIDGEHAIVRFPGKASLSPYEAEFAFTDLRIVLP